MSLILAFFSLLIAATTVLGEKFDNINWQAPESKDAVIRRDTRKDFWYTNVLWLRNYKFFTIKEFFTFNRQSGFVALLKAGSDEKFFFVVITYAGGNSTPHMISKLDSDPLNVKVAATNYLTLFGTECGEAKFDNSKEQQLFTNDTPRLELSGILIDTLPQIEGMLDGTKTISAVHVQSEFREGKMLLTVDFTDTTNTSLVYSS